MNNTLTFPIELQLTAKSQALLDALRKIDQVPAAADTAAATVVPAATTIPPIGSRYQGGIYAGISRGRDGNPDGHIILLDGVPNENLNWADALKWAEGLGNGARLPTMYEAALIGANINDKISPEGHYWSSSEYSSAGAWLQYWNSSSPGGQNFNGKASAYYVRAVRRLIL